MIWYSAVFVTALCSRHRLTIDSSLCPYGQKRSSLGLAAPARPRPHRDRRIQDSETLARRSSRCRRFNIADGRPYWPTYTRLARMICTCIGKGHCIGGSALSCDGSTLYGSCLSSSAMPIVTRMRSPRSCASRTTASTAKADIFSTLARNPH